MLHDGHKLHMCKCHFCKVRNQFIGNLPIVQKTFGIGGVARPRPNVHLVYWKRSIERVVLLSFAHPRLVRPLEPRSTDYRGGVRWLFVHQRKWICLFEMFTGIRMDMVLVYLS